MKKLSLLLLVAFALFSNAFADVPRIISYQGVLTDAGGKPIPNDTNKIITFLFYNTESGGTAITSKKMTVNVIGGLFSTLIELPVFDMNQQLYMEIAPEGMSEFPRIQLASAVHALSIADNCVTSAKIKDGEVTYSKLAPATEGDILQYSDNQWKTIPMPQGVPVGTIVAFYGNTSQIPDGWLLCDGSTVMTSYPLLQQHLITLNGTATLPDLRGQFLRGLGGVDPDAATRTIGSVQLDIFTSHSHGVNDPGHNHGYYDLWQNDNDVDDDDEIRTSTDTERREDRRTTSDRTNISILADGGDETRPKNVAVNYIIKAK